MRLISVEDESVHRGRKWIESVVLIVEGGITIQLANLTRAVTVVTVSSVVLHA